MFYGARFIERMAGGMRTVARRVYSDVCTTRKKSDLRLFASDVTAAVVYVTFARLIRRYVLIVPVIIRMERGNRNSPADERVIAMVARR